MAGKSNKGRNRKAAQVASNTSDQVVSADSSAQDNKISLESTKAESNGAVAEVESTLAQQDVKESETENVTSEIKQGEMSCVNILLYIFGLNDVDACQVKIGTIIS